MTGTEKPNYDAACFHAQQCAEKYLKAYLQFKKDKFGKTHNLLELKKQCSKFDPAFELQHDILYELNHYAVSFRYPGEGAVKSEAKRAVKAVKIIRDFVRERLGLES
ncbi:MAG: HEPN domain-containing protein [bacterium]